jgi:hypothetical protein
MAALRRAGVLLRAHRLHDVDAEPLVDFSTSSTTASSFYRRSQVSLPIASAGGRTSSSYALSFIGLRERFGDSPPSAVRLIKYLACRRAPEPVAWLVVPDHRRVPVEVRRYCAGARATRGLNRLGQANARLRFDHTGERVPDRRASSACESAAPLWRIPRLPAGQGRLRDPGVAHRAVVAGRMDF